jgi:hypothetical protein
MDLNLNDVYQEDAVAASSAAILGTVNVTTTEQLEPDILLSIKKEDLVCPYNLHMSFCSCLQMLLVYFLRRSHDFVSCLTFIFGCKMYVVQCPHSYICKHCICIVIQCSASSDVSYCVAWLVVTSVAMQWKPLGSKHVACSEV